MFGAVSACSLAGKSQVNRRRLAVVAVGTAAIIFMGVFGVRLFFSKCREGRGKR